jgi:LPXTG-motif cell wall-anchored protein
MGGAPGGGMSPSSSAASTATGTASSEGNLTSGAFNFKSSETNNSTTVFVVAALGVAAAAGLALWFALKKR